MDKRILMICYYYPPLKDVGATRSVAFSKYLKKFGWSPYVVSVKNPDRAYCAVGKDSPPQGIPVEYTYSLFNLAKIFGKANGLLARLARIFGKRIRKNYFYQIFCIPDLFLGWIPLTVVKAFGLIKKFNTDIIYVSSTPFSSAVAGVILKMITQKPLVLDFRDPFALEILAKEYGILWLRLKLNRFIETTLLRNADIFIVTTEETRDAYISQYPQIREKIFTVHNGFDAEYFIENKSAKFEKFTIVYSGQFYTYSVDSRGFFEALALLKRKRLIDSSNFQFLFYGERQEIQPMVEENGVNDLVVMSPRIPYREILDVISRSHMNLLRIIKPMISTKLYEGIPLNTPFLATIPAGEVARIINEYSPSSYVITETSPEMVARAILDAKEKYALGMIRNNKVQEFLQNYSRESLTLKLINILERNFKIGGNPENN